MAIAYALFCLLYLGAGALHRGTAVVLEPSPVDRAIPFLPLTAVVYLSQFPLLFLALWRARDAEAMTRTFVAIGIATLVSVAIFMVFPTTIPRPGGAGTLLEALYLFDVPTNCFPSLHVSLALIAAAGFARGRGGAIAWAVLISLSTLTTKQHVAVDVLGGAVVATVALFFARRVPIEG